MAVFIKKVNIPQKSDLINIDMTGSGTAQTYRVLKNVSGSVVEVIGMTDASNQKFASSGQTYENGTLDTYLNSTWYNTLSATAKAAIVDKTFRQDSWYWDTTGNPDYQGKYSGDTAYQLSLGNTSFGNEITRHAYVISVQDVLDYLEVTPQMTQADTTLTYDNVWTMFWNSTTSHSGNIWLRSARASDALGAFFVRGNYGFVGGSLADYSSAVRPAFQIDLSKIDYTFTDGRQPVELKPVSILQKSNNALSRVGMSWKQELPRVTDLTNTKWLINDATGITGPKSYNINFTDANSNSYNRFILYYSNPTKMIRYVPVGQSYINVCNGTTWYNEAYKTIIITGGNDATDTTLIDWFYTNATRIS